MAKGGRVRLAIDRSLMRVCETAMQQVQVNARETVYHNCIHTVVPLDGGLAGYMLYPNAVGNSFRHVPLCYHEPNDQSTRPAMQETLILYPKCMYKTPSLRGYKTNAHRMRA